MHPQTCSCGLVYTDLTAGARICLCCDTSPHNNGMRAGPPNTPGTNSGWFVATFGDPK
jgi:hypothetical protein